MDLPGGKFGPIALRPVVGREIDGYTALRERLRERLGGKQVPPCPPRCEQNQRLGLRPGHSDSLKAFRHAGASLPSLPTALASKTARERPRVKASSMPMA